MPGNRKQPLIGLTLDFEESGQYSNMPWYAIRQNYMDAVREAGGLPVALSHDPQIAQELAEELDGVVVTGGGFDVDPALFGARSRHQTVTTKDQRTRFEWALTEYALQRDIPVFGICGGEQLLNVVLGGTLVQHIPETYPESEIAHEQPNPRTEEGHSVLAHDATLLHEIAGTDEFGVNSAHHQSVALPGDGVVVNAVSPDGVIEGIEHPSYRFCLGVQWHPEYHITAVDSALFRAFVDACVG